MKANIIKITIDHQSQKVEVLTKDKDVDSVLMIIWFRLNGVHFEASVNKHRCIDTLTIYVNTDIFDIDYNELIDYCSTVRNLMITFGVTCHCGEIIRFHESVSDICHKRGVIRNKTESSITQKYHIISGFSGRIALIDSDVKYPVTDARTMKLHEIINDSKCHDKFVFEYMIIKQNRYLLNLIIRSDSLRNSNISEMLKKLNCATEYLGYSPEAYSRINNIVEYYINKEDKYEE